MNGIRYRRNIFRHVENMSGGPHTRSERLIVSSLVVSNFARFPPAILTGLLLIDIGLTFGCSVGVMGQVGTASYVVAVISALVVGVLSVRFRHRSLLMMGLLFLSISALGCGLASNFYMMLISYSITGLGIATVAPMTMALVAEHFSLEKRTSAIGWLWAGASLSYVIGAPVIGFIAGLGGWRLAFLVYVLPISLLGLLLVAIRLPSTPCSRQPATSKGHYLEGFKAIFSNMSATACLVSFALGTAGYQVSMLYSSSFFRQRFLVSTGLVSIFWVGSSLCFTLGSLVSGRLVNRFGRKTLAVLSQFLTGAFIISYTNVPNLWLSLSLSFLTDLFYGKLTTAFTSLTLEQVPRFRGTMMSINTAAGSMGSALGAAVGGLVLLSYGYELVGIILGAMMVGASIIVYLPVTDPTDHQGASGEGRGALDRISYCSEEEPTCLQGACLGSVFGGLQKS